MMHYKKLLAAALTVGCTATAVPVHNANAATLKIGYGGKTRYYTGVYSLWKSDHYTGRSRRRKDNNGTSDYCKTDQRRADSSCY